jgi:hypothetical protein
MTAQTSMEGEAGNINRRDSRERTYCEAPDFDGGVDAARYDALVVIAQATDTGLRENEHQSRKILNRESKAR